VFDLSRSFADAIRTRFGRGADGSVVAVIDIRTDVSRRKIQTACAWEGLAFSVDFDGG